MAITSASFSVRQSGSRTGWPRLDATFVYPSPRFPESLALTHSTTAQGSFRGHGCIGLFNSSSGTWVHSAQAISSWGAEHLRESNMIGMSTWPEQQRGLCLVTQQLTSVPCGAKPITPTIITLPLLIAAGAGVTRVKSPQHLAALPGHYPVSSQ